MTSYETCNVCHGREPFNLGKCDKCSHKPALIETRNINGIQYYALKPSSTKKKEVKPTWVTLWENSGLI